MFSQKITRRLLETKITKITRNLLGNLFSIMTGDENIDLNVIKCKKHYTHFLK